MQLKSSAQGTIDRARHGGEEVHYWLAGHAIEKTPPRTASLRSSLQSAKWRAEVAAESAYRLKHLTYGRV